MRISDMQLDIERAIKDKGNIFFVGRTTLKFCSGGGRIRMLAATKMKMSGSVKKMNKNTYDISSIYKTSNQEVSRSFTL